MEEKVELEKDPRWTWHPGMLVVVNDQKYRLLVSCGETWTAFDGKGLVELRLDGAKLELNDTVTQGSLLTQAVSALRFVPKTHRGHAAKELLTEFMYIIAREVDAANAAET